ncbi:MAG: hypothetical protein PHF33_00720 [Candidatus Delongbacteria bacterium]|nr:hypothetical protein [Candidatus Delongbacteria bacterium]
MTDKDKINNIIDRSEKTQEILTYQPHWAVRVGITIITFLIIGIIFSAKFIEYKDGKTVYEIIFEKAR